MMPLLNYIFVSFIYFSLSWHNLSNWSSTSGKRKQSRTTMSTSSGTRQSSALWPTATTFTTARGRLSTRSNVALLHSLPLRKRRSSWPKGPRFKSPCPSPLMEWSKTRRKGSSKSFEFRSKGWTGPTLLISLSQGQFSAECFWRRRRRRWSSLRRRFNDVLFQRHYKFLVDFLWYQFHCMCTF